MLLRRATIIFAGLAILCLTPLGEAIEETQIVYPRKEATPEVSVEANQSMDKLFANNGSAAGMVVTILGYTIILGALGAVVWIVFKRGLLRKTFKGGEGKLKIAESRMLGNRQFLMVVEYDDQKILLGVGPGKIDYLTTLQSFRGEGAGFPTAELGGLDK